MFFTTRDQEPATKPRSSERRRLVASALVYSPAKTHRKRGDEPQAEQNPARPHVKAQSLESLQPLLPTVTAQADSGAHQINLAALGFSSSVVGKFAVLFPDLAGSSFPTVVKVNVTDAMVNYSQTLFSLTNIDRYRASKANVVAAYFSKQSSRGLVVLTVGNAYLQALALGAQVDNAKPCCRPIRCF